MHYLDFIDEEFPVSKIATDEKLAFLLEEIATHNFEKYVFLLYRLDIDEEKVKNLYNHSDNPYIELAKEIRKRQNKKEQNRQIFTYPDLKDEEKW